MAWPQRPGLGLERPVEPFLGEKGRCGANPWQTRGRSVLYPWPTVFFFVVTMTFFGIVLEGFEIVIHSPLLQNIRARSAQVGENRVFHGEARLFIKTCKFSGFGRPRYKT